MGERERKRESEREADRERDRQRESETDIQTDRQTDRESVQKEVKLMDRVFYLIFVVTCGNFVMYLLILQKSAFEKNTSFCVSKYAPVKKSCDQEKIEAWHCQGWKNKK